MNGYFLADDLSGALDAAAAFHRAGRHVKVVISADNFAVSADEVIGVTTETRNAPPGEAAARVERAIARGQAQGGRLLYKKIDSTLRGSVAAEIAALAAALPAARILFNPANPAVGRTVQGGILLVHGVPVHQTEFARDPVYPVTESDLRKLLGGVGGSRVVFADAKSEEDLRALAERMAAAGGEWVAVGSGALARPVAERLAQGESPHRRHLPAVPAGPILMLCGSAHFGNRAQAAALSRERGVPVHELRVAEPARAVAAVVARLQSGGGASLLIEETRRDSPTARRTLVAAAVDIVVASGAARVFVTGGETAFSLCGALGIPALEFRDELEPGLSLSGAATARGPLLLAIKPGGFGNQDTWVRAWDRLRG